jgi:hypothetical protein
MYNPTFHVNTDHTNQLQKASLSTNIFDINKIHSEANAYITGAITTENLTEQKESEKIWCLCPLHLLGEKLSV